jgi:hypothetical protein
VRRDWRAVRSERLRERGGFATESTSEDTDVKGALRTGSITRG